MSISEAREMVEMGVLNSWVILLMKSFFISEIFFCLKKLNTINEKAAVMTSRNITERMIQVKI
jgi:hypothetical protein